MGQRMNKLPNKAPEVSLYKGHPVITIYTGKILKDGGEEFITVGVRKAAAICDQIDYIRRFVDQAEGR